MKPPLPSWCLGCVCSTEAAGTPTTVGTSPSTPCSAAGTPGEGRPPPILHFQPMHPPGPPIWGVTAKLPSRHPSSRHGLGCRNPTSPQQAVTTAEPTAPAPGRASLLLLSKQAFPPHLPQDSHRLLTLASASRAPSPFISLTESRRANTRTHTHTHTLACCKHGLCRACNLSSHLVPSLPPY